MGAEQWLNSTSGPDWTDVLITMRAIEDSYKVSVVLSVVPGVFAGPSGMLTVSAREVSTDASVMGSYLASISGEWPCREHKLMEACVYSGLLSLDFALYDKLEKQKTLSPTV